MNLTRRIIPLTSTILLGLFLKLSAAAAEHIIYKGHRVHPTQILVQLKPGRQVASKAMTTVLGKCESSVVEQYRHMPGLLLLDTHPIPGGGKTLRKKNLPVAPLPGLDERIRTLEKCGLFEFVEPDYVRTASATPGDAAFVDGRLWGLQNTGQSGGSAGADINIVGAWDLTTGSRQVIVGVIDTGIRYTHNDLANQMWRNEDEIPGNQIDDDNDGYIDNIFGINAVTDAPNPGDPMDDNGHGTHVAGTIGAAANNGSPHVGVAWDVRLMALKFLDSDGSGKTSDEIKCIDFAIENGADVINASYGGPGFSSAQEAAMRRAEQAGILFVAAAGNEASNSDQNPSYPASFDLENVISVAAIDRHDNLASFSNFGANSVDLAAPGVDIFSCWIGSDSDYKTISGTSMASPHVAGVAALIRARFPNIGIPEQRALLLNTVTPTTALMGKMATGGRANAFAAVNAVADGELEAVINPPPGAELLAGSTLRITVRITDLHDVTDATITGTANGQASPTFLNDGSGPDQDANDAIYATEMIVPSFESQIVFDLDASAPGKQPRNLQFTYLIAQPAPNNNFSKATILDSTTSSVTGSNRRADAEPGEPKHAGVGGGNTVWWQWVATSNGTVTFDTRGSDFDTVLAVYTGTSVTGLTEVAANDDVAGNDTTSTVSFNATAGTAYSIVVDGFSSSVGDVVLNLDETAGTVGAPANDDFSNAVVLIGNSASTTEPETSGATKETNEPDHAANPGGRSVWYQWQATDTGMLTLSTLGSAFDTLLAVYTGNSVDNLTEVAANDDSAFGGTVSRLETLVTQGTTYHIAVDGYAGANGALSLHLDFVATAAAPTNDDFADAIILTGLPIATTGSNLGATVQTNEPLHAGNIGGRSVWWRWTAPDTGPVTVDTANSDFDTLLAIYQGTSLTNLTRIAANDDGNLGDLTSRVTLPAMAGQEYFIAVDGYASLDRIAGAGSIHLNLTPFTGTAPANDSFANATIISGVEFSANGSTEGATTEPGEPSKAHDLGGASVWWNFSVAADTLVEVNTLGSDFDTTLGVFTGADIGSLALIIDNDDSPAGGTSQSALRFIARAGMPYRIVLDGYNGQVGNYQLNLTQVGLATSQYRTGFEATESFTAGQPLGGQGGWTTIGSGVHEIRTTGFANHGQAGSVGGISSTAGAAQVTAWRPLNVTQPTNRIVRFRTRMQIVDSTNGRFDFFSWQVFNQSGEFLFGVIFNNQDLNMGRILDNNIATPSGFQFANGLPFRLEIEMDFSANLWVAYYDGFPITPPSPITTTGKTLNLGDIDAVWDAADTQNPGDNRMEFDNFAVDFVELTLPPEIVSTSPNATVTEGAAITLNVTAHGPGTLSYQWLLDATEITGATQDNLVIDPTIGSDAGAYTVRVSNQYGSVESLPIFIEVVPPPLPPANDHFANATVIASLPHEEYTFNDHATHEPNEPQHGGQGGGVASIWWQWTAPADGRYSASTLGSSFDTLLSVYQGNQLNALTLIAANDDFQSRTRGSLVSFDAVAGVTYRFAVDGLAGASGNVRFALALEEAPQFDHPETESNGDFSIDINPPPGVTYILQSSLDLKVWTDVTTITGSTSAIEFTDSTANTSGRFYRLIREQ